MAESALLQSTGAVTPAPVVPVSRWAAVRARLRSLWQTHPGAVICGLALLVRIIAILALGVTAAPVEWGDDKNYDAIATQLVIGHEYVNTWYPPGYPLFLVLIYELFGRSLVVVRLIQAALGTATCILTYRLGKRVFDDRVGRVAGIILALYPGHAYICWRIMAEPLFIFLLLVALNLAVSIARRPRVGIGIALGLVMGGAQLVKSNLYVLPVFLVGWIAFGLSAPLRQRWAVASAVSLSLLLVASVTPIANRLSTGGGAAALPGNAGRTFWLANNPLADGYYIFAETEPAGRAFLDAHGYTERLAAADEFERDRLFFQLGMLWIREHPREFLVLCFKKLDNAFGLFPRAVTMEGKPVARAVHLLSYGLIAPLAVVGMLGPGRRRRYARPLFLVLLSYAVMVVIYYGTPRFTIIVMPVMILFASATLRSALEYMSTTRPVVAAA